MDFLAAETLIQERLKARLPAEVAVMSAIDLTTASRQVLPVVLISFAGLQLAERTGALAKIEQAWEVTIGVSGVNDPSGARARRAAGVLLTQVLSALLGWTPAPQSDGLVLSALTPADPIPATVLDGVLFVPTAWTATSWVRGID